MENTIEIKSLCKRYKNSSGGFDALDNVSLSIKGGEIFAVMGESGAGKSTLVRCINLLEKPSSGTVTVGGTEMGLLSPAQLREKRRSIGMIFQDFNLLMQRTALENVCLPLYLEKMPKKQARARASELLTLVGLSDKADSYPAQLSGGQQQRVAIARALATKPKILLCDEATSALDSSTAGEILDLLHDLGKRLSVTVVLITHQLSAAQRICNRIAVLDGGKIAECESVLKLLGEPKSDAARRIVFGARQEKKIYA